jgi:iron(III) transport system substrate-binding protein
VPASLTKRTPRLRWTRLAASGAVAASLVVTAAACGGAVSASSSASGSSASGSSASGSSASAAPLSQAALIAGSKNEKGLVIYSNALLTQTQQVIKAFQATYPWIHVTATDDEDPVIFSKYAAEHATGARTADILIASAPGLWVGAVAHGYLQPFTPSGISNFPSFISQGKGLYVFSPDPAITIYNKIVLKGQAPPATVAQIAQEGADGKYKVATYTINNDFGYSAFWAYVHQKGWAALDKLGQTAQTPGDGDVLGQDVAQGGFAVAVFESGLARGPIETVPADKKLLGWEYTKDFTPLIPRGIGITAGAASPDSAKLFLDFVFSGQGQQALCDAGFEASSNTFTPGNGCPNTLKALYAAVGGAQNTYMAPFSAQVASEQASFTARFRQAFHQ